MGEAFHAWASKKFMQDFNWKPLRGRDPSTDLGVNGKIILN
jgi:hypothetical protein